MNVTLGSRSSDFSPDEKQQQKPLGKFFLTRTKSSLRMRLTTPNIRGKILCSPASPVFRVSPLLFYAGLHFIVALSTFSGLPLLTPVHSFMHA